MSSVAFAADLPDTKGAPLYAPPPPVFSWNGAYVGGQVGYEWGTTTTSSFVNAAPGVRVSGPSQDDSGVVGGGHVGYNYQISQFIVGAEGDVNGADYTGNGFDLLGLSLSHRTAVDGSIRARAGIAFDRILVYGTGGVAFASIRNSVGLDTQTVGRVGWTAGGGVEYAIDNNWSVRAEYRYTDYGHYNLDLVNTSGGLFSDRFHDKDNRVQAGFSYKFDMFVPPAPVIAKY
ncbi:MAG: outer membrane protein [Pseudomonadota bacterium]